MSAAKEEPKPKSEAVEAKPRDEVKAQVPQVKVTGDEDESNSRENSKESKEQISSSDKPKKKKESKNKKETADLHAARTVDRKTMLTKKEKADRAERMESEALIGRLTKNLGAMQERMYQIRFDEDLDPEEKMLQLRNFAAQILLAERQLQASIRESIEVFEDQLDLHDLGVEGLLDQVHAAEVADVNFHRTGSFMRTPSTQTVQDKEPKKKWQAVFKMHKEKKDQMAMAQGQYVASRDSNLHELDEEITKLRAAVTTLSRRKNLSARDERSLETMQEQLKVRVHQKERLARALVNGPQ